MAPVITSINPITAFPGEKVSIYGSGFIGATAVQFGGYNALTFRVVSDSIIEAYLGVDGNGVISVTNGEGTANISGFIQQKIKKKIPDFPPLGRTPAGDDKVLVWAQEEGKTVYANLSDLPLGATGGTGNGGGTITYESALWKVRNFSTGFAYDPNIGHTIISDIRLLGIDDAMIACTQVASEFRDDQLVFDPKAGTVALLNFELSSNEHITININGAANFAYNSALQQALSNIADQAKISAPFKPTATGPNGAKVLWMRPANEIPPGWQEFVAMRGFLPMAQDPNDNDFSGRVGIDTGGAKSGRLTVENIPEHQHELPGETQPNAKFGGGIYVGKRNWGVYGSGLDVYSGALTGYAGNKSPDPVKFLNPYRIVMWIEYIGLE